MTKTIAIFILCIVAAIMGLVGASGVAGHEAGWFTAGACVMLAVVIGADR